MADIYVFICEHQPTARAIIEKHFDTGRVTFAEMFPAERRDRIVAALETVEDDDPLRDVPLQS